MKKTVLVLVAAVIMIFFGVLVRYAYVHKRGGPEEEVIEHQKLVLQIPYLYKKIDLKEASFDQQLWNQIRGIDLKLVYQVTVTPWGSVLIPDLKVKAFHNGKQIYFKLAYSDKTKNDAITMAQFSDGASIMFPLGDNSKVKPESIMMGFQGKVNIWHWRAFEDREYWVERETRRDPSEIRLPVSDLIATGIGTLTPKKEQRVLGRGYKTDDGWDIIFVRELPVLNPSEDAEFAAGKKYLCAFAVWDGEREDRGPRKSISDYIEFRMGATQ